MTDETTAALNRHEVDEAEQCARIEEMTAQIAQEWKDDPFDSAWQALTNELGLMHPQLCHLIAEVMAAGPGFRDEQIYQLQVHLRGLELSRRLLRS